MGFTTEEIDAMYPGTDKISLFSQVIVTGWVFVSALRSIRKGEEGKAIAKVILWHGLTRNSQEDVRVRRELAQSRLKNPADTVSKGIGFAVQEALNERPQSPRFFTQ